MKTPTQRTWICWALAVVCLAYAPLRWVSKAHAQEGERLYAEAFAYSDIVERYAVGYTDEDTTFEVLIYDAPTDQLLHTVEIPDPRLNRFYHQLYYGDFDFSPQGDRLAISLEGPNGGGFFIIDVATGQLVLYQPWASIWFLAWSPDANYLAGIYHHSITGGLDGWLALWDARTGEEIKQHPILTSPFAVDWHPADDRLAFADRNFVVIWDVEAWREVYRVPAADDYVEYVYRIAWNPSGDRFAALSDDDVLSLWDKNSGELPLQIDVGPLGAGAIEMFWSPDSQWIGLSDSNRLRLWNANTGDLAFTHEQEWPSQFYGATFVSDRKIMYVSGYAVESLEISFTREDSSVNGNR